RLEPLVGPKVHGVAMIVLATVRSRRRRVFPVNPISLELLIFRQVEERAVFAGFPADDLVRLAALVAHLFPAPGPALIGVRDLACLFIEKVRLAFAVRLDAEVDRGNGRVSEVGGAEGLGVARAHALEEMLPESVGVFAGLWGCELLA